MRTVLLTGTGGAGRTTVAAATAADAARRGLRTLLLTAGPGPAQESPPGLSGFPGLPGFSGLSPAGDARPVPLGPGTAAVPVAAVPGLWTARADASAAFRADATALQDRLGSLLDLLGTDPLDPEELTPLPGAGTLALLRALRDASARSTWDVVVADLPPVDAALTALALPEQLRRYLRRLVPAERRAARALRPVLAQLAGVPMPAEWVYEAAAHADRELAAVQSVVEDRSTTVRLVVEPGPAAGRAVAAARTGLALFGHRLDAVVANRLLPTGSADPFLAGLSERQQDHLKALRAAFESGGPRIHELPHLGHDPGGAEDLAALAPGPDTWEALPEGPASQPWTMEDRLADAGHLLWRLPLPGATRDTLDLARRDGELVVDAAGFRRILPLPSALRRCAVAGAALRDGALQVRFTPDPELWPR